MFVKRIVVSVLLLSFLVLGGNAFASYNLSLVNLPSAVQPGGGSFAFDVYLTDPTEPYMGWSFSLLISGQGAQDGVNFNLTTPVNSKNDPAYVFSGNSYDYQCGSIGGNSNSIMCADLTNDLSTVSTGGLLAHLTVDYDASAGGIYDISVGSPTFNFVVDGNFNNQPTGQQETVLGSTAVAPEPVSAVLFIVGVATLGVRGYYRNRK
ncbi:MAG: hypothetical protein HZA16_02010 [Nitrospirae bacterium]|nr:hypothetical protein [Nitrospirota bacterium]